MQGLESEGWNPQGLPVVICGPEPEQQHQQRRQAHAAAPAEEAAAAVEADGSVYGSLADNGLDGLDESEDQESFTGPEPPRPVPSEPLTPRSRHTAAAICVKVRGAELDDPTGCAQVQTKVSQLTYFNVFEWNDMMGKFWADMMALDEAEAEGGSSAVSGGASVNNSKVDAGSGGPVGAMSGEDLIAAAIELSSRMGRKQGVAAAGAAGSALGDAASAMLTEVEKRALDWTTAELEEVKAERDKLQAELSAANSQLQRRLGP